MTSTPAPVVPRPSPADVALVAAGGAVGSAARYGVGTALGGGAPWPVATALVNVVGAFLLGVLLEALVRRGPESVTTRRVRLTLGTGLLGGFTTYSALALEVDRLLGAGQASVATLYGLGSVALGVSACLAGVALAAAHHRWRTPALPVDPDAVTVEGSLPHPASHDHGRGTVS